MPHYRLYHLNGSSGHIDQTQEIYAADDVDAVAITRSADRYGATELWQEGRKVLRLEAPSRPAPSAWQRSEIAVAG